MRSVLTTDYVEVKSASAPQDSSRPWHGIGRTAVNLHHLLHYSSNSNSRVATYPLVVPQYIGFNLNIWLCHCAPAIDILIDHLPPFKLMTILL